MRMCTTCFINSIHVHCRFFIFFFYIKNEHFSIYALYTEYGIMHLIVYVYEEVKNNIYYNIYIYIYMQIYTNLVHEFKNYLLAYVCTCSWFTRTCRYTQNVPSYHFTTYLTQHFIFYLSHDFLLVSIYTKTIIYLFVIHTVYKNLQMHSRTVQGSIKMHTIILKHLILHKILCLTSCQNRLIETIITSGQTQDFVKKYCKQCQLKLFYGLI